MKKPGILILTVFLLCCSFAKSQTVKGAKKEEILKTTGYLKNLTGLDACGWVIQIDKNTDTKLEPLNLKKFKLKLVDGKEVEFTYKLSETNTACMAGKVIVLQTIKYKKK